MISVCEVSVQFCVWLRGFNEHDTEPCTTASSPTTVNTHTHTHTHVHVCILILFVCVCVCVCVQTIHVCLHVQVHAAYRYISIMNV